jgi:hypothetical protein
MAKAKIITKPILGLIFGLFLSSLNSPAFSQDPLDNQNQVFDLSHAREALHYFEDPSTTNITNVAFTSPARKLMQFYNDNNSDGTNEKKSTFLSTQYLLSKTPDTIKLDHVKALLTLIADNKDKQNQCYLNALAHLPKYTKFRNPLYIVWAGESLKIEDSIINISNFSMINITDKLFETQPQTIWTSCVHALHHAVMNELNPIPFSLKNISLSDELIAYIEQITLFEGSAYYASNPKAVGEIALMDSIDKLSKLKNSFGRASRPLTQADLLRFHTLFENSNLARDAGALMAQKIDKTLGREPLVHSYSGGPASFFRTYSSISK